MSSPEAKAAEERTDPPLPSVHGGDTSMEGTMGRLLDWKALPIEQRREETDATTASSGLTPLRNNSE